MVRTVAALILLAPTVAMAGYEVSSFKKDAKLGTNYWNAASALDKRTEHLAYLAVLAALRMESGVPFHAKLAKAAGASRDEVISAVLVGLPAAGLGVTQALPAAIDAYDSE